MAKKAVTKGTTKRNLVDGDSYFRDERKLLSSKAVGLGLLLIIDHLSFSGQQ